MKEPIPPLPRLSNARPPELAKSPEHVAIVINDDDRWVSARGLPRIEGHRIGEVALVNVMIGILEIGVKELSAYAFSTRNWKRSPAEVRFITDFSRQVLQAQHDDLNA